MIAAKGKTRWAVLLGVVLAGVGLWLNWKGHAIGMTPEEVRVMNLVFWLCSGFVFAVAYRESGRSLFVDGFDFGLGRSTLEAASLTKIAARVDTDTEGRELTYLTFWKGKEMALEFSLGSFHVEDLGPVVNALLAVNPKIELTAKARKALELK